MTNEFQHKIGQRVHHACHTRETAGWVGIIEARELYETFDGAGRWYYVRWIRPLGDVSEQTVRLHESQLV